MDRNTVRWLLGLTLVSAIGLAVAWRDRFDVAALQIWVESAGSAAPLVFIALYAAATVLFLPGSVITLAGGVLFGPVWGTLWSLTGATLGAFLAFLIARYLGSNWIARRAGPRLSRLNDGVAAGALAFTWLGYAGREALSGGEGTVRAILIALALVTSMAFLPRWIRKFRAKPMPDVDELKRQLDAGEEVLVLDVRGASEFTGEGGHISGALNLALEDLPNRMAELEDYKQSTIRLVCQGRNAIPSRVNTEAQVREPSLLGKRRRV